MNQLQLIQLGMLIILIGVIIIIASAFLTPRTAEKSNVKFSVFGLFGFIPFGISNDKRLFIFSVVLTLILIAFTVMFFYKAFR